MQYRKFKIESKYRPAGDQPKAIDALVDGINKGDDAQTLLGITGSGKTFTIANVIERVQMPTLIIAHNKTLAAQLYNEFKELFPENAVEYFISYYRIPVSQLLPYNALIVPFAYFFYYNIDKPTGIKQKYLQDYFWRCALSGRFSSSVEAKLGQDVKRIDAILNDELPKYDWSIDISEESMKY